MNVVVALDFSPHTSEILQAAHHWGSSDGTEPTHFYLLHVAEPDPDFVGWEGGPEVVRDQMAEVFQSEHRELGGLAEEMRATHSVRVTPLLIQGATVKTILEQGEKLQASLIVVGSHGRGATYDLLIGSVSAGIIRKSTVPVLVVPVADRG